MAIVRMTLEEIKKKEISQEELERIKAMPDELIDIADIPPPSEDAKRVALFKPLKEQVTIRLDSDVLMWLKKGGKGYQTRINSLLRKLMLNENH